LESRILDAIPEKASPMRQVIRAVRASYGENPPDKTTVWRAIKKLVDGGLVDAQAERVVREYTEYLLSAPKLPVINFDEEFSLPRLGEKLQTALKAREIARETVTAASPPRIPNPRQVLSRRAEGELAALAENARREFERVFKPLGERSYALRR